MKAHLWSVKHLFAAGFHFDLGNFESQLDLCSDAEDIGSLKQVSEGMMI